MNAYGQETNNDRERIFRFPSCMFRLSQPFEDRPPPPPQAMLSDLQGVQLGSSEIERTWLATVVTPQTGGAPSSKWTRKTRPWFASLPTTVVASSEADTSDPIDAEYMANPLPYSLPEWRPQYPLDARGEGALMRSVT